MIILSLLNIISGILFAIAATTMKDGETNIRKTTKVNIIAAILFSVLSFTSGFVIWSIR